MTMKIAFIITGLNTGGAEMMLLNGFDLLLGTSADIPATIRNARIRLY